MTRLAEVIAATRHAVLSEMAALGWSRDDVANATGLSYQQVVAFALKSDIVFKRKNGRVKSAGRKVIRTQQHVDGLRALAATGVTRVEAAQTIGVSYHLAGRLSRQNDIQFRNGTAVNAERNGANQDRAAEMARFFTDGMTLEQIGFRFGVTRERVRQVLKDRMGLVGRDGGQTIRSARRHTEKRRRKEEACLDRNGCTLAERREMQVVAKQMQASGIGRYRTPLYAFKTQRNNAKRRSIEWKLSLWQWWQIWLKSGLWDQRGRGQGYMMCRKGDLGPYALGNVFIAPGYQNSSEGQKKTSGLPIGVKKNKKYAGFSAMRMIHGVKHRLGSFKTSEEAHAAYLAAGEKHGVAA